MGPCMKLSVIIPTRNRAASLGQLLTSIVDVESPSFDWEVLVLDNESTDGTRAVVESFQKRMYVPVRYIHTDRPGLHVGRNTGAREANGECLAYLDDDTLVSSMWWRGAIPVLDQRVGAVAGRIVPKWDSEPPGWLSAYYQNGICGALTLLDLGPKEVPVSGGYVWGANFFVRRHLVLDLGGFHPDGMPAELLRYRGDGETGFFKAFEMAGQRACYSPVSTVSHVISAGRLSIDYLCQRQYNQGISDSYTQIRSAGGVPDLPALSRGEHYWSMMRYWQEGKRFLQSIVRGDQAEEQLTTLDIEWRTKCAYRRGFEFHQREVRNDHALLEWVLQKDYW